MGTSIVTSGVRMPYVPPPGPPLNLQATSGTASSIQLSWTAAVPQPGTSIAFYNIYREDSGNFPPLARVGGGTTTFTDIALTPGTLYTYRLVAIDSRQAVSAVSNLAAATPGAVASAINWLGTQGTIVSVGGDERFHFQSGTGNARVNDLISHFNICLASDPSNIIGACGCVFDLTQIEGAFGDYSQWFTDLNTILNYLNTLTPPRKLFVKFNVTGNAGHAAVPSYMLNNPTYGKVASGGYQGGLFDNGNGSPIVRFDVPATNSRIAAAVGAAYAEFGNAIFGFCPLYSEVEGLNTPVEMSSAGITAGLVSAVDRAGSPNIGFFDQLRAAAPKAFLCASFSFMDQADLISLFGAMDRNNIALMNFDTCNEAAVRSGGNFRIIYSAAAWRGGDGHSGVFVPNYPGLIDRRQLSGSGRVMIAHIGADELGQRPLGSNPTSTAPVPPAHIGDGTLGSIHAQEILMEAGLRDYYFEEFTGPACNILVTFSGQPANYTSPPFAYTNWGNGLGFWTQNPPPAAAYPRTYP